MATQVILNRNLINISAENTLVPSDGNLVLVAPSEPINNQNGEFIINVGFSFMNKLFTDTTFTTLYINLPQLGVIQGVSDIKLTFNLIYDAPQMQQSLLWIAPATNYTVAGKAIPFKDMVDNGALVIGNSTTTSASFSYGTNYLQDYEERGDRILNIVNSWSSSINLQEQPR